MEKKSPNLVLNLVSKNFCKLFLFLFLLSTNLIFSQTDNCDAIAAAGQIPVGNSCNFSTFNSSNNTDYWNGAAGCNAGDLDDAWGWFTATSTSTIINYQPADNRDAILHLFTGSCSTTMSALACSNIGGNGILETITYATTVGEKYMVRIQRRGTNNSMDGQICVYSPCHPLTYCSTTYSSGIEAITNVTFAGINNTTSNGNSGGSQEIFCNEGNVSTGSTYSISVNGDTGGNYVDGIMAYFDWNQDGDFADSNESYAVGTLSNNNGFGTPATSNITVPVGALIGKTTMRIVKLWNAYGSSCNNGGYGQTEDYVINVNNNSQPINYCTPTTQNAQKVYINKIDFIGTLNDVSHTSTYTNGYQDFTGLANKAIQAQGEGVNIILNNYNSNAPNTGGRVKAWIDWNKDGVFSQNSTEEIYNPGAFAGANLTFGFIIPPTTTPGFYRIRFRVYNNSTNGFGYDFNPCENFTGGSYSEVEDYLFEVISSCSANISSVNEGTNCGSGSVSLSATGTTGTTSYKWYTTETGGTAIPGATSSTYTTPSLSTTTTYYVTALNGTCESVVRTPVTANIVPTPTISITPENPVICGENVVISIVAGGDKELVNLVNENFESGTLGSFSNVNNDSNNATTNSKTAWQIKSSSFIPTNGNVWYPAISSGIGSNKFALATSDISPIADNPIENSLTLTNSVNTTGFLNLNLKFKMYYSRELPDNDVSFDEYVKVQVSENGTTWTDVDVILSDKGIGTKFATLTYNLNSYINKTNLKVRINHRAFSSSSMWLAGGVAIDDIKLYGEKTLTTSFNYNTSVVDAFSDAACTIPYFSGTPATTIYIKPTISQLENATFNIPVSTTLSNGCVVNGSINVTNNTKLFTPSATTADWNDPSNWKPYGVPTSNSCVVVLQDLNLSGTDGKGLNLIVKAGKTLNVAANNSLTITDKVTVENTGTFQLENNANLVQINNVLNSGNIIYKRTANGIKGSDYVYWSSPVSNQLLNSIYASPSSGPKYKWNTLFNNGNGASGNISQGNWVNANNNNMDVATGYIVRGSSSISMAATNINTTFTGVPNNGTIVKSVSRGTYVGAGYTGANGVAITKLDDNYNLIGNPYPSSMNALQFLTLNSSVINGQVKLWSHSSNATTSNSNQFYGSFQYNYNNNDYITINGTASTNPTASEIIKAGQAFFVIMQDGPTTSADVTFNNSMRSNTSGNPFANDNFFKTSDFKTTSNDTISNTNSIGSFERHRIWLDIVASNNASNRAVIGYVTGATMDEDNLYDAFSPANSMRIYSLINEKEFLIQGRSLPFVNTDQVPLGFTVSEAGTYHIAINAVDGLFEGNQDIYIKDELLNTIHNLKLSPYQFTTTSGIHNDRFKIVYTPNDVLSTNTSTINENEVQITKYNGVIEIVSGNQTIDNVKIYDIRGRLIVEKNNVDNNMLSLDVNNVEDQVLIVNVITTDNIKFSKKVL